jgi:hypothetical protein
MTRHREAETRHPEGRLAASDARGRRDEGSRHGTEDWLCEKIAR